MMHPITPACSAASKDTQLTFDSSSYCLKSRTDVQSLASTPCSPCVWAGESGARRWSFVSLINVPIPVQQFWTAQLAVETCFQLARSISRGWIFKAFGGRRYVLFSGMPVTYLNPEYLDLWDLPDSRLTSSLATEVEENFYTRCPPERSPEFYGSGSSPSASPNDEETVSELITPLRSNDCNEKKDGQEATSQPKKSWFQMKPKTFKTDSAGNKKYDSSLLKALHRTFFVRWWTSGLLVLIAGELCWFIIPIYQYLIPFPAQIPSKPPLHSSTKSYLHGSQNHTYITILRTSRKQLVTSNNLEVLGTVLGWLLHYSLCKVCCIMLY